jgi:hypothetical protein
VLKENARKEKKPSRRRHGMKIGIVGESLDENRHYRRLPGMGLPFLSSLLRNARNKNRLIRRWHAMTISA